MEKTVSINLGGVLFYIDEGAYARLSSYLDTIKNHYRGESGEEILKDIEASIAEKLLAKTSDAKKIVSLVDVEEIIKVMGTVEEFEADEDRNSDKGRQETEKDDTAGKPTAPKKLYRSSDNVIIAGVCSGIAVYFGIDPLIVRLAFILFALANGLGIIVYVIFWLILPSAESSAAKLEMKGMPVNLKKIEETVKEKSAVARAKGEEAYRELKRKHPNFLYALLSLPVKIIEVVVIFIKKLVLAFFPVLAILVGLVLVIASLAAIVGLSTTASLLFFQIDSPYLVSDLPLAELAGAPMYFPAVAALYFLLLIPVIFLFSAGITLVRRKNSFRLAPALAMIVVWIFAAALAVTAAAEFVPAISSRVAQIREAETIARAYDYRDFSKLYIGADMDLTVRAGEDFKIEMSGRERDLDRLDFRIEEGQLQITQTRRETAGKLCLFCISEPVKAEITLPTLESYVGIRNSQAEIISTGTLLYISLGEAARADMVLNGNDFECRLSGIGSHLEISGTAGKIICALDGNTLLEADDLSAQSLEMNMGAFARAELEGQSRTMTAKLSGYARLVAPEMTVEEVSLDLDNYARADVLPKAKLKARARDYSRINYRGEPAELEVEAEDFARVEPAIDLKLEIIEGNDEITEGEIMGIE